MSGALYTLRDDGLVGVENNGLHGVFYFNGQPSYPDTTEGIEEYLRVRRFRDELYTMGIVGSYKGLRSSPHC